VPVGVPLGVLAGVVLPLNEALPVLDADAPTVTDAVGLAELVELPLSVEEGVAGGVPVAVGVGVGVGVAEPLLDGVALPL
jgi:hypothetical protein